MQQLQLPEADLRIRQREKGSSEVFDPFRKKYVKLTPEEWVRQHFLYYLVNHMGFPAALIVVEAALVYNGMKKRFDILAYDSGGKPVMIVECKAPSVAITQDVFDQIAMYNMSLEVDFLLVTNGLNHYACKIDHKNRTYSFLKEIPAFREIVKTEILNPEF